MIGNKKLSLLSAEIGQTPFYAYDRNLIKERVNYLRNNLPETISIHYAMKANPMPALVDYMTNYVDGLDVASHGELLVALNSGMPSPNISFAGPGKSLKELKAAIAAGILINAESTIEVQRIEQLGKELSITPRIALRINPDFELKASGMKMSGGPKPFGIDAEQVPQLIQSIAKMSLDLEGFHIFSGSQNLKAEAIIDAHNKTFELAFRLTQLANTEIKHLNIGGGLGIPYFPGDTPIELGAINKNLQSLCEQTQQQLGPIEIVMELGRFLVGEAGIYVAQISDIKISRGEKYLIVNGGMHHHLANSGNFGQVVRKNYPVLLGNKCSNNQETELVTIVGPLCTPLDILANKLELPKAEIGDYVVILQSGAYGKSVSPENFLGHPGVVERLV